MKKWKFLPTFRPRHLSHRRPTPPDQFLPWPTISSNTLINLTQFFTVWPFLTPAPSLQLNSSPGHAFPIELCF